VAPLSSFPDLCESLLLLRTRVEVFDTRRRAHRLARRGYTAGIFLLAALVISVVCLAHVIPPDPTWIPGIYDNGDFDDAALAVLSIDGATITTPLEPGLIGTPRILPSAVVSMDLCPSFDLPPSRSPPLA
jgi:hypothetical protein